MSDEEIWAIARRRASYALATIADHQMNTWTKYPKYPSADTPTDIIANQIANAMFDALKARSTGDEKAPQE